MKDEYASGKDPIEDVSRHARAKSEPPITFQRKINQQAWAILPKIREVDTFLRSDPTLNQRVRSESPGIFYGH